MTAVEAATGRSDGFSDRPRAGCQGCGACPDCASTDSRRVAIAEMNARRLAALDELRAWKRYPSSDRR